MIAANSYGNMILSKAGNKRAVSDANDDLNNDLLRTTKKKQNILLSNRYPPSLFLTVKLKIQPCS